MNFSIQLFSNHRVTFNIFIYNFIHHINNLKINEKLFQIYSTKIFKNYFKFF